MTSCIECKTPTTEVNQPHIYYCFDRAWDQLFVPILNTPKIIKLREFITKEIYNRLSDAHYIVNFYSYTPEFLEKLSNSNNKLSLIDSKAWGKFSFRGDTPEDIAEYKLVTKDEYDDYKTIGHYLFLRECQLVSILTWTLCSTIWPLKKWIIVENDRHFFVMTEDDPYTIYDILWPALGIPASEVDTQNVKIYKSPLEFYVQCLYGLDPRKSEEELLKELKDELEILKNEERFSNRVKYELPVAIEFGKIFT